MTSQSNNVFLTFSSVTIRFQYVVHHRNFKCLNFIWCDVIYCDFILCNVICCDVDFCDIILRDVMYCTAISFIVTSNAMRDYGKSLNENEIWKKCLKIH